MRPGGAVRRALGRRTVGAVLIALTCGTAPVAGSATEAPVTLSPEQLQHAATLALQANDPARALAYADALIRRDPADFTPHLIRARALRDLGENKQAKAAAHDAVKAAQTDEQKYAGAMVMAQVQSSAGNKTLAQLWLRRAIELAPNEGLERRAIRDFKYVRATNPWSTRLNFSITPDSNINDGSSSDSSFLNYELSELLFGEPVEYELSGAAKALPGIQYTFGLDTRYRFYQTDSQAHDLYFQADLRHYTLSEEARAAAPGVSGEDFGFASVFVGYGYRRLSRDGRGESSVRADLGQSWYGGSEYAQYARLALHQAYIVDPRTRIGASLSGERQFGIATADVDTVKLDLWGGHGLRNGHKLFVSLTSAQALSPVASEEFTEFQLRASLIAAQPLFGATAQFGLGLRTRGYDVSLHSADGRRDEEIRADATFVFKQVDYHGFNPTLTIFGARKSSNIDLFESNNLGVNFGIQSAF